MSKIIVVDQGKHEQADFGEADGLSTGNLEACVAVVTYTPKQGSIGHLTNASNLGEYFSWLKDNVDIRSKARIGTTRRIEASIDVFPDIAT